MRTSTAIHAATTVFFASLALWSISEVHRLRTVNPEEKAPAVQPNEAKDRPPAEARLSAAWKQIERLKAENERLWSKLSNGDPVAEAELDGWLSRASALRSFVETFPELGIPEMEGLRVKDWLDASKDARLETEADLRLACARLRAMAKRLAAPRIAAAIKESIQENGGRLPTDLRSIAGHLKNPADAAAVLQRYELNPSGQVKGISGDEKFILIERPVDDVWDSTWFFAADGAWGNRAIDAGLGGAIEQAMAEYRRSHGTNPTNAAQLAPLLDRSIDPDRLSSAFQAVKTLVADSTGESRGPNSSAKPQHPPSGP